MLESPQFLFRQEVAEPDPHHPGAYRLDAYSKASQLELFSVERRTRRETDGGRARRQARHCLGIGRAKSTGCCNRRAWRSGVRAFFSDMLQFDLFDTLAKDCADLSQMDRARWRGTRRNRRCAASSISADAARRLPRSFHDPQDLPDAAAGVDLRRAGGARPAAPSSSRTNFPPGDPRAGLHAQASFVALHSHEGLSSPTLARQGAARAAAVRTGSGAAGKRQFRHRPGHAQSRISRPCASG